MLGLGLGLGRTSLCAPVYADLSSWKRVATMLVALAFGLAAAACSLMAPSSSPSSLATPSSANSNCSKLSSLLPFLPPG